MVLVEEVVDRVWNESEGCREMMGESGKEGEVGMCRVLEVRGEWNEVVRLLVEVVRVVLELVVVG